MTARKAIGLYVVGQVSRERLSVGFLIARRLLETIKHRKNTSRTGQYIGFVDHRDYWWRFPSVDSLGHDKPGAEENRSS